MTPEPSHQMSANIVQTMRAPTPAGTTILCMGVA